MSKRIFASISLGVEIYDLAQLRKAAAARAKEEGISLNNWEEIRRDHCDDLRMLLDPGSIPGTGISIIDSSCE